MARIDLRDFKTKQIFGPVPNISGYHGGSFVTPNTEYVLAASRFSIPLPKGTYKPMEEYATNFHGIVAGLAIDPNNGNMSNGWAFWTSYNSERATGKLEVTSTQRDRDYIVAVNWKEAEKAANENRGVQMIDGIKVIDPKAAPGIVYL